MSLGIATSITTDVLLLINYYTDWLICYWLLHSVHVIPYRYSCRYPLLLGYAFESMPVLPVAKWWNVPGVSIQLSLPWLMVNGRILPRQPPFHGGTNPASVPLLLPSTIYNANKIGFNIFSVRSIDLYHAISFLMMLILHSMNDAHEQRRQVKNKTWPGVFSYNSTLHICLFFLYYTKRKAQTKPFSLSKASQAFILPGSNQNVHCNIIISIESYPSQCQNI